MCCSVAWFLLCLLGKVGFEVGVGQLQGRTECVAGGAGFCCVCNGLVVLKLVGSVLGDDYSQMPAVHGGDDSAWQDPWWGPAVALS